MSKLFTALGNLSNSNAAHQRSNVLLLGWPAAVIFSTLKILSVT
jgi:hypothetical protein